MKQPKKLKKEVTSLQQKELEKEVKRQRKFIKEIVYPYVCENSKSIEDGKMMLKLVQTIIQQAFGVRMKEAQIRISEEPLSQLNWLPLLESQKDNARYVNLLTLFENEKLSITDGLLGGLLQTIEGFVREESDNRPMVSLKTEFL